MTEAKKTRPGSSTISLEQVAPIQSNRDTTFPRGRNEFAHKREKVINDIGMNRILHVASVVPILSIRVPLLAQHIDLSILYLPRLTASPSLSHSATTMYKAFGLRYLICSAAADASCSIVLSRYVLHSIDNGKHIALAPGMNLSAEIRTGKRRVIDYLLSPVQRHAEESMRER